MLMPAAEFWRLWGTAIALACAASLFFAQLQRAHAETCRASFYGAEMHGRTASGAPFRPMGLSAAHRTYPFGTRLRVSFEGRSQVIVVNDRGPAASTGRCIDLSRGAARALGLERRGTGIVSLERLH